MILALGTAAHAEVHGAPAAARKDRKMTTRASGSFEVQITPQAFHSTAEPTLGRMSIAKQLHGDLEATSVGEMLTAGGDRKDSGAYVAVERVTGTLHGKRGSFSMQHLGTMTRGAPALMVLIVPDSGSDELAGIAGTFTIHMAGGKHTYDLDYTLPAGR